MAAGNGFLTVSPDARYGNGTFSLVEAIALVQRFTCPGSGQQQITEIGAYFMRNSGSAAWHVHFGIFTHDSPNNCPEAIVENSDSGEITINDPNFSYVKHFFSYPTCPLLTGGSDYWLGIMVNEPSGVFANIDRIASSFKNTLNDFGPAYPTWPSGADWHTHTDQPSSDLSLYAVYEAAPPSGPIQEQLLRHGTWFGSGVKQSMWWAK